MVEILGLQDVLPPPEYIEFLEKFGCDRKSRRRGHCLYYPENLEVPSELARFGGTPPVGFYFAYREQVYAEGYKYSQLEHCFYYFRERDPSVYRVDYRGVICKNEAISQSFTEWLDGEELE